MPPHEIEGTVRLILFLVLICVVAFLHYTKEEDNLS